MTKKKQLTALYWMGFAFLIVLAGVLWDGLHGDWNWHSGLTLAIILVNAEILRRRPTQ
ncbi:MULTISPECIES: hypothetical protein [unclassified Aureimonas]|uniref:hypothetical protein n=1 Tax=unclassified Aureimonas TaxID=2615206 RepID=UPI000AACF620|nr:MULTISPECIES: hypothetical protein [unclassified Aureimonas]